MSEPWTPERIEAELQNAGRVLQALGIRGVWPGGAQSSMPEIVRDVNEGYGWDPGRVRPARPGPDEIAAMDRAFGWLQLIPGERWVLRRIVAARSMTHRASGRTLYSWRRIAAMVGASHMAVSRWHRQGLEIIAGELAPAALVRRQAALLRQERLRIKFRSPATED